MPPLWFKLGGGLLLLGGGLALFFNAFRRLRLRFAALNTPTARIRSAAAGRVELKGLAAGLGALIRAPFSGSPCAWWRASVERRTTDSKGNRRWQTLHQSESGTPFKIRDAEASLMVVPSGAEIEAPLIWESSVPVYGSPGVSGLETPQPSVSLGRSFLFSGRMQENDLRYREWRLDEDRPLYILGVLRSGSEGPYVGQGRAGEAFVITHRDEAAWVRSLGWSVLLQLFFGSALILVSAWIFTH